MADDYRPRLNITLTQKQFNDIQEKLPWGFRSSIYGALTDQLITLIDKHGVDTVLGCILTKQIVLSAIPNED